MTSVQQSSRLAALRWAVERDRQAAANDELACLNVLLALQQLRDDQQVEVHRG
ncbi:MULTISPECIES: hypothetical protein [unclassified Xanthomonas]|uniref:hypothetical protein n=1 Tax=unclassified Xanthomonas TaxID=2643310 RepID=UPI002A81FD2B|nr:MULTISPECIES: hypothetical protein [unclassified Xanthomonas]MDY4296794.1 hypothetical protein [Xanthomonas sp. LF02-5]MDY4358447.1 hypothetical protein [Xanthomonas sp. LF04-12]